MKKPTPTQHDSSAVTSQTIPRVAWNDTVSDYRADATVQALFEEQVDRSPDAPAVVYRGGSLTYRALDERANRLAHYLRGRGVTRDVPVALCLERGADTIVTVLAILKAGGVYLPLEPTYPIERLAFMLRDAGATLLVTHRALVPQLPQDVASLIILDDDDAGFDSGSAARLASCGTTARDRAYVMYTSGSTGTPKGVEVVHRAINRLVCDVQYVALGPDHTVLHAAPLAFDASTFEIWGALLTGGRCALYPDRVPTGDGIRDAVANFGVTTAWLTAGLFNSIIDDSPEHLRGLAQILTGGEALSVKHVRRALEALPETQLINGYGPTETTTFAATFAIPRDFPADATSVPIGRPIRDTFLYVLDADRRPVPVGSEGELYIGGEGCARGYLGRPDLTAERFVPDPYSGRPGDRMYRTSDLVRQRNDGLIEYIGRIDTQVKISGYRIELGEIEAALLRHPSVQRCVVMARDPEGEGPKQLVAYLVPRPDMQLPDPSVLRDFLRVSLPTYMLPAAMVPMSALPLTDNGKVDYRALPAPVLEHRAAGADYAAPRTDVERALAETWAALLNVPRVGIFDHLFELGASSLLVVKAAATLRRVHGIDAPVVRFFQHARIADLAASLGAAATAPSAVNALRRPREVPADPRQNDAIAIVGMSARFPGAANVDRFWRNLCEGVESISRFGDADLDPTVPALLRNDPQYVRARGVLQDVEMFDAGFFGMSPREAQLMDPQQRVFLELAWEALEHAGHVPAPEEGAIGVFAGVYNNSYLPVLQQRPELVEAFGAFNAMLLNEKDYVATRTAHKLGLTGPAISIHTACSTSLVAICQAVLSLRAGQCDVALAGGASLTLPTRSGYLYQEGSMLSPDGSTRTFDARSGGTVFSDGAGVVVLRRLADSLRDGDTVYAVIRGVGVNNDGAQKASFTAPSVEGQAAVIQMAQQDAAVDARTISYVEAHGTATPLGDPIEFEALNQVFRAQTDDTGFCGIGSVKSNIGHTVIGAGVAGVIKTALSLHEQRIPATLHFTAPNPNIDIARSPFAVTAELTPWPRGTMPRRAGVSSFGVGGTNAHVVLEEAPLPARPEAASGTEVLVLSARSPAALETATGNLAEYLRSNPTVALADVAHTLQAGRKSFSFRRSLACTSVADAAAVLEARDGRRLVTRRALDEPTVVFLFPGQGSQYVGMGATLYDAEPVFRDAFDRCVAAARPVLGFDLRELLHRSPDSDAAAESLRQTSVTQPALFAVEYSLAVLWQSWGVTPSAMLGHSVGEFVAATLAGVFSLADGMRLVAERGRMMQALPPGAMLSVRQGADAVVPHLTSGLAIASDNAPNLCVVSGPFDEVEALRARLESQGALCRPLQTSHAFHSDMMLPVIAPFASMVRDIPLASPTIPFVSSVTGDWITDAQARDPMYWAGHLRETVRFARAAGTILRQPGGLVLLESGPRATLSTLVRQQLTDKTRQVCIASLGSSGDAAEEGLAVSSALGELWTSGVTPDWQAAARHRARQRISLPTYPFERQRHWVDARPAREPDVSAPLATSAPAIAPSNGAAGLAPLASFSPPETHLPMPPQIAPTTSRRDRLVPQLREALEQVSGLDIEAGDTSTSFVELGFDSLVLTQVAIALTRAHGVKITFRQLMEEYTTLDQLAAHLDTTLPPEATPPAPVTIGAPAEPLPIMPTPITMPAFGSLVPLVDPRETAFMSTTSNPPSSAVQQLIEQQLRLMTQQLALLSGAPAPQAAVISAPAAAAPSAPQLPAPVAAPLPAAALAAPAAGTTNGTHASNGAAAMPDGELPSIGPAREFYDAKKAFGAAPRITVARHDDLTPKQRARLDAFIRRYTSRTKGSKQFTQENRSHMADPRVVTGFRPSVKELVYPLVMNRSAGSRMWDLDGNEYLDVLSGFGSNLFGWRPQFVVDAVKAQLEAGFDVGPQHPLAGEVAKLFCEVTDNERAAFCNTGSEAVLGAMRIARTVTGRNTIVIFTGSYHGINDEVIVRGNKKLKAFPAAPGIMPSTAENVLVLDYGTEESLAIIRERAGELAAVMVEPVQSRRPDFQPADFLRELRTITSESGIVFIWDEIVTGFRAAPGGAQEHFGIRGDLATYGKVVGGGMPIGVIAGKREFMDALDGGFWQFGDSSVPEVGVTYFAGTFVRHPLALAAARAVLLHLKTQGPALQRDITARSERLQQQLNEFFRRENVPLEIRRFTSVWKTFFTSEHQNGDLLFYMLRDRGIHIYDGFPCFMTAAHTDADVETIVTAFKEAVAEMRESGFLLGAPVAIPPEALDASRPPLPGARLGRDRDGSPAWFVAKDGEPGKFVKV